MIRLARLHHPQLSNAPGTCRRKRDKINKIDYLMDFPSRDSPLALKLTR